MVQREQSEASDAVRSIIQRYIDRKKLVEAIILDTIAFNETEKVTKKSVTQVNFAGETVKYTQTFKEFWPFRCVQLLSSLPTTYSDYFGNTYRVNPVEFDKALAQVRASSNQKLYKYLDRTLADAKTLFSY